jgi:hypothetical protein
VLKGGGGVNFRDHSSQDLISMEKGSIGVASMGGMVDSRWADGDLDGERDTEGVISLIARHNGLSIGSKQRAINIYRTLTHN